MLEADPAYGSIPAAVTKTLQILMYVLLLVPRV